MPKPGKGSTHPQPAADRSGTPGRPMERPELRGAEALSLSLAALMAVQSAGGLLLPGMYRDEAWILAAWFGNDLVTLLVAVPLLLTGLMLARRNSMRGEFVWYAALGYGVYNYAFYVFGARMNVFFPLYVVLFAGSAVALILALRRLDPGSVVEHFPETTPVRTISGYMLLTGAGLGVAWLAQWAAFTFRGIEPGIGEEPFTLIAAMDLSFIVPWFVLGGFLLWNRRPWGFVLAAILILKGATYTLVLTTGSVVGARRGIEGAAAQIPLWAAWTLAGVTALVLLLRSLRAPPTGADPSRAGS